jgi:hypothetical protein
MSLYIYILLIGIFVLLGITQATNSYSQDYRSENSDVQDIPATPQEKENCITYNNSANVISINCKNMF